MPASRPLALALALAVPGCHALRPAQDRPPTRGLLPADPAPSGDPRTAEVPLPTRSDGWNASLILDNGDTGIWTVEAFDVFPQYGCPDVVGLDDRGVCHVMVSYSGKWTPVSRGHDGKGLGGLAHGDVDPRIAGAELYTGSQRGNLYQLVPHADGTLDARLIGQLPGLEIHTIVAGDLDPRSPGAELLVFTNPAHLYRVSPTGPDGTFATTLLEDLPGRVRDAAVLPPRAGRPREIATVSRGGWLRILTLDADGTHWSTVDEEPMGMGRLDLAPPRPGAPLVLYSGTDDGRVLRHERNADDTWATTAIYSGPQGVRGVAAGAFAADPDTETVAVFGYSGRVQLLTRTGDAWSVETLFQDRDKGHWLRAVEVDGRNGTRELVGSGYGGRIFLLSRPPGFGREGVATDPDGGS